MISISRLGSGRCTVLPDLICLFAGEWDYGWAGFVV